MTIGWIPSQDSIFYTQRENNFWSSVSTFYRSACAFSALPRYDLNDLFANYVIQRTGDRGQSLESLMGQIPDGIDLKCIGATEARVLDFLFNYSRDRVLVLNGPRGAGKTSLLHYVDALVKQARSQTRPTLVILNGLELDQKSGSRDIALCFKAQFTEQDFLTGSAYASAFKEVAPKLENAHSVGAVRDVFLQLARNVGEKGKRELFLVFDNLDHLWPRTIGRILNLARDINIASGLACILCLRPGSEVGVHMRGDARAFFRRTIKVTPPEINAWLGKLGSRCASVACNDILKNHIQPINDGITLGVQEIQNAFDRFALLLRGRHPEDNAVPLLETVSASDTRHLIELISRILRHRSLPGQWLLSGGEMPSFHPLTALFEASGTIFRGDDFIPNLLYIEQGDAEGGYLIGHRILRLIGGSTAVKLENLIDWMHVLGYDRSAVLNCLRVLMSSLLIRGNSAETIGEYLPEFLFLTEAGNYYRNHLLRNVDYLVSAVLDTPLRHGAFKKGASRDGSTIPFALRFESFLEYVELVRSKEDAELRLLTQRSINRSLRRISNSMQGGGLFSSSLSDAIDSVIKLGFGGSSKVITDAVPRYSEYLLKLRKWITAAEIRLEDIMNRGRKARLFLEKDNRDDHSIDGNTITIRYLSGPDCLRIFQQVFFHERPEAALLGIVCYKSGVYLMDAHFAFPRPGVDFGLIGDKDSERIWSEFQSIDDIENISELGSVPHAVEIQKQERQIGLLVPKRVGDNVSLNLSVQYDRENIYELCSNISYSRVKDLANASLERVNKISDNNKLYGAIQEEGSWLATEILTASGRNVLASAMQALDIVVIFSTDTEFIIPWEWLRPVPKRAGEKTAMICEASSIVRWPAGVEEAIWILGLEKPPHGKNIKSFGLPSGPDHPTWRHSIPDSVSELTEISASADVIHLVGHFDKNKDELLLKGEDDRVLPITFRGLQAHGFGQHQQRIIITGCDIAMLEDKKNLALQLSRSRKCRCWAPMTKIEYDQATDFDLRLTQHIQNQNGTVESYFGKFPDPTRFIYARFGM